MTKEIALHHLKHGLINEEYPLTKADKQEILKVLEQETVSKEVYDHEYFLRKEFELKIDELQRQLEEQAMKAESILNKIRAEITDCLKALDGIEKSGLNIYLPNEISGRRLTYQQCLKFIDKYKAESEDKE